MQVRKRTPRTEMEFDVIASKMSDGLSAIAKDLDAQEFYIDRVMTQYARLSNRVIFAAGEVDFEIALPSDSPSQIQTKFEAYLDSDQLDVIEEALNLILEADMPANPITAPNAVLEGDLKK